MSDAEEAVPVNKNKVKEEEPDISGVLRRCSKCFFLGKAGLAERMRGYMWCSANFRTIPKYQIYDRTHCPCFKPREEGQEDIGVSGVSPPVPIARPDEDDKSPKKVKCADCTSSRNGNTICDAWGIAISTYDKEIHCTGYKPKPKEETKNGLTIMVKCVDCTHASSGYCTALKTVILSFHRHRLCELFEEDEKIMVPTVVSMAKKHRCMDCANARMGKCLEFETPIQDFNMLIDCTHFKEEIEEGEEPV